MNAWNEFADALADRGSEQLFAALCLLVQEEIGAKLFTVMTFDESTRLASRVWSSMPRAYPPQGTKPMGESNWDEIVLRGHRTFVANTIEDIAEHFSDHPLIRSLGCESCINVPVVVGGEVLGTLNCLHEAQHYTPERVERARRLVGPGALCLMRVRADEQEREAA